MVKCDRVRVSKLDKIICFGLLAGRWFMCTCGFRWHQSKGVGVSLTWGRRRRHVCGGENLFLNIIVTDRGFSVRIVVYVVLYCFPSLFLPYPNVQVAMSPTLLVCWRTNPDSVRLVIKALRTETRKLCLSDWEWQCWMGECHVNVCPSESRVCKLYLSV